MKKLLFLGLISSNFLLIADCCQYSSSTPPDRRTPIFLETDKCPKNYTKTKDDDCKVICCKTSMPDITNYNTQRKKECLNSSAGDIHSSIVKNSKCSDFDKQSECIKQNKVYFKPKDKCISHSFLQCIREYGYLYHNFKNSKNNKWLEDLTKPKLLTNTSSCEAAQDNMYTKCNQPLSQDILNKTNLSTDQKNENFCDLILESRTSEIVSNAIAGNRHLNNCYQVCKNHQQHQRNQCRQNSGRWNWDSNSCEGGNQQNNYEHRRQPWQRR